MPAKPFRFLIGLISAVSLFVQPAFALPLPVGPAPVTADYTYDAAGRLTGEERTQSAPCDILYGYDRAGNRALTRRDGLGTLWAVDAGDQLVSVRDRGVVPYPVDVSEFLGKGGGAVKCMLLDLGQMP